MGIGPSSVWELIKQSCKAAAVFASHVGAGIPQVTPLGTEGRWNFREVKDKLDPVCLTRMNCIPETHVSSCCLCHCQWECLGEARILNHGAEQTHTYLGRQRGQRRNQLVLPANKVGQQITTLFTSHKSGCCFPSALESPVTHPSQKHAKTGMQSGQTGA